MCTWWRLPSSQPPEALQQLNAPTRRWLGGCHKCRGCQTGQPLRRPCAGLPPQRTRRRESHPRNHSCPPWVSSPPTVKSAFKFCQRERERKRCRDEDRQGMGSESACQGSGVEGGDGKERGQERQGKRKRAGQRGQNERERRGRTWKLLPADPMAGDVPKRSPSE